MFSGLSGRTRTTANRGLGPGRRSCRPIIAEDGAAAEAPGAPRCRRGATALAGRCYNARDVA
ncbi:MAG: hypothetical protein MZV64_43650 [Ignavibacteriales bacterium]|nr:hypothetical protein [Ignavibacteriales bacterium]